MVRAIVGSSWGDEGKGKITDLLAGEADAVVRFQGGANAGHTIINAYGKNVLHLLPSGVFNPEVMNVIAGGVALDAEMLFAELEMLREKGVPKPRLAISARAQLLLPVHRLQDRLEEKRLGAHSFGSTQSGIAPFYADKYAKKGIQIAELFGSGLREKAERLAEEKNVLFRALYGENCGMTGASLYEALANIRERLGPMLCDGPYLMQSLLRGGKRILLEGQLGALRDPDNGIYPFVTSSSPLAGFACAGAGISPQAIQSVTAVVKAYSTCVGAGAFVGELNGEEAETLRRRGGSDGEYGALTGRPRRVAWFDAVAARYGCMLQGATEAALTMVDVLGYLEKIPVCVGYEIDGKITGDFPLTPQLERAKPVYTYLDGWRCDVSGVQRYEDLPVNCRKYIEFVEREIGVPVTMVSNGPHRNQILYR